MGLSKKSSLMLKKAKIKLPLRLINLLSKRAKRTISRLRQQQNLNPRIHLEAKN